MNTSNNSSQCASACSAGGCEKSDWAGTTYSLLKVWGLLLAAFVVGFFAPDLLRAILWAGALFIAGGACVLNAYRCKRMHCYFSGPYFLAAGVFVVLAHLGVIPVALTVWLGLGIAVGGLIAYFLPEYLWGRYRGGPA